MPMSSIAYQAGSRADLDRGVGFRSCRVPVGVTLQHNVFLRKECNKPMYGREDAGKTVLGLVERSMVQIHQSVHPKANVFCISRLLP